MAWVGVGVAAVGAGVSLLKSNQQKKAADKIKVGTETVSKESKDALAMKKAKVNQGFAGKAQALELGGAASANALGQAGPGGRNALLGASMKQGSDQALKLATLDAEAKEANQAGYIAGVEGIGDKEEAIQQREIGAAQSAKAALLGASDQNFSGALTAAAGGAEVAGTYLTSDEAKEKRAKKKAEKEGTK